MPQLELFVLVHVVVVLAKMDFVVVVLAKMDLRQCSRGGLMAGD
jgi:hypothetical protein